MRSNQPPTVATWLLQQFGCSKQKETILGDLTEQYRLGRSRLWYWRQCVIAIAMDAFRELGPRKFRTIAAICVAWIIFAFYRSPFDRPLFQSFSLQLKFNSMQLKIPPNGPITYWMHVVVVSLAFAALAFFVGAFSGQVVAKLQPSARVPAVLTFTASLSAYWLFALVFSIVKSGLAGVGVVPGHEIRDVLTLPFSVLPWVMGIVGVLMGGGLLQSHTQEGTP